MSPALRTRSAAFIAPYAREWIQRGPQARLLHVFPWACNLIDERGEVISLVAPGVGAGPFSLVVDSASLDFTKLISDTAPVTVFPDGLRLGQLFVDASQAQLWAPHPDWQGLHAGREEILSRIPLVSRWLLARAPVGSLVDLMREPNPAFTTPSRHSASTVSPRLVEAARPPAQRLLSAIANGDLHAAGQAARRLAGLGPGLTPAGDDFLMGAAYAVWTLYPISQARSKVKSLLSTAIPLTTSLSSAWLKAAARGEAGARWHEFFEALIQGAPADLSPAVESLLSSGHTSGADALAGYTAVFYNWDHTRRSGCLS